MRDLLYAPCVYVAGTDYMIVFATAKKGMAWADIGGKRYADSATGLMRWDTYLHRITVPQTVLDAAGAYTVRFMEMTGRKPYFPEHGEEQTKEFRFTPVDMSEGLKIYHIADTHGRFEEPVACANRFPDHVLVFDGDIASHNSTPEDLYLLFRINEAVTGGERPIFFARGNHDTRGPMAYYLPEMIPMVDGKTYFTFRTGDMWGITLDCGEDKLDFHAEYGETIDFEAYRTVETEWLEGIAASDEWKDAKYRIAICHVPFTERHPEPFNIDEDKFARWVAALNTIGVDALICGHEHVTYVTMPGDEKDAFGQKFPTVVGSSLNREGDLTGCALELDENGLHVRMTGPEGNVVLEKQL